MPNNVPQNLPVEGKSLLNNLPGGTAPPAPLGEIPLNPPFIKGEMSPPPPPKKIPLNPLSEPELPSRRPFSKGETAPLTDDIFSDVKEAPAPKFPSGGAPVIPRESAEIETPQKGFKKIALTIGSFVVAGAVIASFGWLAYTRFLQPKPGGKLDFGGVEIEFTNQTPQMPQAEEQAPPAETPPPQQPAIIDSDNDGLTDTEEQTSGTNSFNPDSDGDRLFDGEEVNVYKTDPLNKDTDGDTYEDGAEVQAGYDPKGPGKLIRIPAGE